MCFLVRITNLFSMWLTSIQPFRHLSSRLALLITNIIIVQSYPKNHQWFLVFTLTNVWKLWMMWSGRSTFQNIYSPSRQQTAPNPPKPKLTDWTNCLHWSTRPRRVQEPRFIYIGTTIGMATPIGGVLGKWEKGLDFFFFWSLGDCRSSLSALLLYSCVQWDKL